MMWFWPGAGWLVGLLSGLFWIAVIVAAIVFLRREVPNLGWPSRSSQALRILEERYARGEISREEFLERRAVLVTSPPTGPPPPGEPPPNVDEPTVQLPEPPPSRRRTRRTDTG
ncbi:MAG TPA: SHOCT domain-containing protein [Actinomycetota bacterium]|nr:SHOCT domain-containing protein [Actinomycetota bacterium]